MSTPNNDTLPGQQWTPSNSTVGYSFLEDWCMKCARDRAMRECIDVDECDDNERCEILGASFMGEAVEWREMPDGEVKCIAFVASGDPIPTPRCHNTIDLFGGS